MRFNEVKIDFKDFTRREIKSASQTQLRRCGNSEAQFKSEIPYSEGKLHGVVERPTVWRRVWSVALDAAPAFFPGDSVGLLVPNDEEVVDALFSLCSLCDAPVCIERGGRHGFLYRGTLRNFFLHHFDFSTLPKKAFLHALSKTTPEAEKLEYLCSKEGASDYFGMARNRNTVLDIIKTFHCRPSADVLVQNCELIKPRFFSLTNRPGECAEVLVGAVPGGHVSRFVAQCTGGEAVRWYVKENRLMRMTGAARLLCICTGTGIAPFISFLRGKKRSQEIWIVYGCRAREDDLSAGLDTDENTEITRVLSSEGKYVTDLLGENTARVSSFLSAGNVFLCGSPGVQKSVFAFFTAHFGDDACRKVLCDDWR